MTFVNASRAAALVALVMAGAAAAQDSRSVTTQLERSALTTPQEKRAFAASASEEVRGVVRQLTRIAENARRNGNGEVLDCVTTALTSARALQQVADAASVSMGAALDANEIDRANHEFRKIAIASSKSRQLLAAGDQCASGSEARSTPTSVEQMTALTSTEDETRAITADLLDLGFDPPDASPF